MIKYRYALDNENNLIDVNSLERNLISKSDKFYSIDFMQELIPRLGQIKVKHFAHKPDIHIIGSGETYLHALGKKVFKDEYLDSLMNGKPFMITYITLRTCTRLKSKYNITCELPYEEAKFDLTKYFTEIREEKRDGLFIPDLMLLNPNSGEKIYIEIAVTHLSSIEKQYSDNRIIEITLSSEDDVNSIIDLRKGIQSPNIEFHNFKMKKLNGSFCKEGQCISRFLIFSVSQSGKCNLKFIEEKEIESLRDSFERVGSWYLIEGVCEPDYIEIDHYRADLFKQYVAQAQRIIGKVKNCYLCRYHADNTSKDYQDASPIFCKFQKTTCHSNFAAQCKYYRVEQTYVESDYY